MANISAVGATVTNGTEDPDTITGDTAANTINGLGGADTILGNAGADVIDGGTGADLMIGGLDADIYAVDNGSDQVIESSGDAGNDTVNASVSYALGSGVSVELLQTADVNGTAAINLTGNESSQAVTGNAGANTLDGGVDATGEVLTGGLGNDTYLVRLGDTVVEGSASGGIDQVFLVTGGTGAFTGLFTTGANVELVSPTTQASVSAIDITGGTNNQTLIGNFGRNVLTTGGGTDTLIGLQGDDDYVISAAGNAVVQENDGEGSDRVFIDAQLNPTAGNITAAQNVFTLGADASVEVIDATVGGGTAGFTITGNRFSQSITGGALADSLVGGDGADTIVGAVGNDTITGDAGNDSIDGGDGNDSLAGGDGNDTIIGGAGTDSLNGGVGTDSLTGNGGSDIYTVDTLADVVVEGAGDTADRVNASTSYYIGTTAEIEILTFTGTDLASQVSGGDGTFDINQVNTTGTAVVANPSYLVGNNTSQLIVGDAGSNILNGFRGVNGDGAGLAQDTLVGLNGDDIYRVYGQVAGVQAGTDVVVEDVNGGGDIIYTSATFSLVENDARAAAATTLIGAQQANAFIGAAPVQQIEVLSASTQAANLNGTGINLTGNAYGNIVIGDFGTNIVRGGGTTSGGVDVLYGLVGNDTYIVDSTNTFVNENAGEGFDTLQVNATNFTLNAGSSIELVQLNTAGVFVGNEVSQSITGSTGNDTLNGGGGSDTLAGGTGNDAFQVDDQSDVVQEAATTGGVDTIFASANYDLRAGSAVEVLTITSQASTIAISLTGNEFRNIIVGNNGDNTLNGDNDTVNGTGVQIGTAAGDVMVGLGGNDTYRVFAQADEIVEAVGGGSNDVVFSSGNYQLDDGQEVETLSSANQASTSGLTLRGNEFGNVVIGTDGVDLIDGRGGNDLLIGRGGADVYAFTTTRGSGNVDTIVGFTAGDQIGLGTTVFAEVQAGGITADEFRLSNSATPQTTTERIIYNQATGEIFYDADANGSAAAVLFAKVDPGLVLGFNDFTITGDSAASALTYSPATTVVAV